MFLDYELLNFVTFRMDAKSQLTHRMSKNIGIVNADQSIYRKMIELRFMTIKILLLVSYCTIKR